MRVQGQREISARVEKLVWKMGSHSQSYEARGIKTSRSFRSMLDKLMCFTLVMKVRRKSCSEDVKFRDGLNSYLDMIVFVPALIHIMGRDRSFTERDAHFGFVVRISRTTKRLKYIQTIKVLTSPAERPDVKTRS